MTEQSTFKKYLLFFLFGYTESKNKVLYMILYLLLGYLMAVAFLYAYQRNFIYFPDRSAPVPALYNMPDMEVTSTATGDGLTLRGWYKAPRGTRPVVIMFHGNGGNIGIRNFKARPFLDQGYGVLLAEYRGYGGNAGESSETGFYKDGRAWMKALADHGIPPARTVIYGESIGSGTAVQMAIEYPGIKALILESPFTSLTDTAQRHMFYVPCRLLLKDRFDNLSKIKQVSAPLLVLHGAADTVVPYALGRRLFEAAVEPKTMETYPLGGHNDLYMHGAFAAILNFLDNLDHG